MATPAKITNVEDKYWFDMHIGAVINKENIGSVFSNLKDFKLYYYLRKDTKKKLVEFSEMEDCKRLVSLFHMYYNDTPETKNLLHNCGSANIAIALNDAEVKANQDRDFISETVGNDDIADILINKFAPLEENSEAKKEMKLRRMHAAMRAISLIKKEKDASFVLDASTVFEHKQFKEAGTSKKLFQEVFNIDQAQVVDNKEFITKIARNALISYSLFERFDELHRDDPYYAVAKKEVYDAREKAAKKAVEFANGKTNMVYDPVAFQNSEAGTKKLHSLQCADLSARQEAELALQLAQNNAPKKGAKKGHHSTPGASVATEDPDEPDENLLKAQQKLQVKVAQAGNLSWFARILLGRQ